MGCSASRRILWKHGFLFLDDAQAPCFIWTYVLQKTIFIEYLHIIPYQFLCTHHTHTYIYISYMIYIYMIFIYIWYTYIYKCVFHAIYVFSLYRIDPLAIDGDLQHPPTVLNWVTTMIYHMLNIVKVTTVWYVFLFYHLVSCEVVNLEFSSSVQGDGVTALAMENSWKFAMCRWFTYNFHLLP